MSLRGDRTDLWQLSARALQLAACAVWLLLTCWRLPSVPGLDLDEAWYVLSARGEWPPADPLSGMTRYSGPFPVLLLELAPHRGGDRQWLLLRVVAVACNALALFVLSRWLKRRYPAHVTRGWALPLLGTLPLWLVYARSGFDMAMFGPLLGLLGLYGATAGHGRAALLGGLAWGISAYSHVLGAFTPLGIGLAWVAPCRTCASVARRISPSIRTGCWRSVSCSRGTAGSPPSRRAYA